MFFYDRAERTSTRPSSGLGALTLTASLLACSSSPPPAVVVNPDASGDAGGSAPMYAIKPLGCGSAGTQSVVAVSGSTVAFASLAKTTMKQPCTIMPLGPVESSNDANWNVCYAAGDFGGAYKSQVVKTEPYFGATGVGLAFNAAGSPTLAYAGVGATPPMETCGSNDVFVTTLQTGVFGNPVQVSHGSQSDGLVASSASECSQNICEEGDTTGFWPSIGFDPGGNAMIAFRDEHFGFANDDFAKSDVELAEQSGGNYPILTVDVSRGGGIYNRVAFSPAGLPAVLHYDATGEFKGVYLNRQVKAGSISAQTAAGAWVSQQLSTGTIQPQLGFAISSKGLYAAAYFDDDSNELLYTDSTDGTKWSVATPVDSTGRSGLYPSLAFDPDGNPAIAYYRCNAQSAAVMTCDPATDGLYLARRTGTTWALTAVHADPSVSDGLFPALAFVGGKAVIAFQETSYDPVAKVSTVTWWVAEEP